MKTLQWGWTLALLALAATWTASAHAELSPAPKEKDQAEPPKERVDHLRVGAFAGVGFPRPLAVEGFVKIEGMLGLGLEYSALPPITSSGVQVSAWALAGDGRFFPFRGGPFFLGVKVGRQTVTGSAALTVSSLSMSETMSVETWFVNPRIGLLWTWKPGITFGMEAGVQVPVTTTVSSSLPVASLPADVTRTATMVGQTVLPTVDLLRIGFLF